MGKVKKYFSELNIYYKFFPYLLFYLLISLIFNKANLFGDEIRYLHYAHNILNGFLSKQYAATNLCSGPGYPLFIVPFLLLGFPVIALRFLNSFLLYFSLVINYKTFSLYSTYRNSFIYAIILGLYFPIFKMLPLLYTECLAWFLVSLVCFLFLKNFEQEKISWKYVILASVSITYLAMTKIIFGYVITVLLIISIVMFILPKFRSKAKKPAIIFLLSFVFCLPWLFYTFSITKVPFLWTWAGSSALYTMSTPFQGELGDWSTDTELLANPNHRAFMESISKLNIAKKDSAYESEAIKNISNHPAKYFYNWMANVGRIFFSYPFSNSKQTMKTYFTLIPNMFIIVLLALTLPVSIVNYKKFPEELILLFLVVLIYLGGSTLVSGFKRIFFITIPFWFLLISFVFSNVILIKIRK